MRRVVVNVQTGEQQEVDLTPEEIAAIPPPEPPGVPQIVTASQGVQQLIAMGYHHDNPEQSAVEACINRISDPVQRGLVRAQWLRAQVFERNWPVLLMLALTPQPDGLGMTEEELDEAFVQASQR
jgi:hypothetical protein